MRCSHGLLVTQAAAPFMATVNASRLLTADTSDRRVLHVEVGIKGSKMKYHPGDSIGTLPLNDPVTVDAIIARCALSRRLSYPVSTTVFCYRRLLGKVAPIIMSRPIILIGWFLSSVGWSEGCRF